MLNRIVSSTNVRPGFCAFCRKLREKYLFSGTVEDSTAKLAIHAGEWLRELIATRAGEEVTVVGPAPCPIERIKNRWRWHVLLKSAHPGELTRVSRYFMERFEVPTTAQLRVTLDRDPVALL